MRVKILPPIILKILVSGIWVHSQETQSMLA